MRSATQAVEAEIELGQRLDDLKYRLWHIQQLLQQATQCEFTALALSNAMEIVARHYRAATTDRISMAQRDELLSAVVRAPVPVANLLTGG
jgi:hypothetical protein